MGAINILTLLLTASATTVLGAAIPADAADINYSTANVVLSSTDDCNTVGGYPSQIVRGECYKTVAFQSLRFYEQETAQKTVAVYASDNCTGSGPAFTPFYIGCNRVGFEALSIKYLDAE